MRLIRYSIIVSFINACGLLHAHAHPHSFIDLKSEFVIDNNQLIKINMQWTIDEMTSASLLYDVKSQRDQESAKRAIAQELVHNVSPEHFFTHLMINDKVSTLRLLPDSQSVTIKGLKVQFNFSLVLSQPTTLAGHTLILSTYEPTYYVDMSYLAQNDYQLINGPTNCTSHLTREKIDQKLTRYAQSLDTSESPPVDMNLGKLFSQRVIIQCPQ